MSPTGKLSGKQRRQYSINLTMAVIAGQVGFLVVVVIVLALIGGLWLDREFDTKPLFTILLVVAAGPVSLYLVYRITTSAVARIKPLLPVQSTDSAKSYQDEGGNDE
jgi:magnesium-transporting ATPase (P-type)